MKKIFNNPLFCRKILASIALTLATIISLTLLTSLSLMPTTSFAQTNTGGQGTTPLTTPQPTPRGDGGCDSTCSLGVPPSPVSQTCVSNQETRAIACSNPTPVGTINQRRSPVYCNGTIVSGGTWTNVSNNCVALVCTPTNSTQTIACPAGYSGGVNQSKTDTTCNDGTSTTGTWTTTSNTCTLIPCPATSPSTTAACGSGFNSGVVTTAYSMSAAPSCTQTSAVSNTCSCSLITSNTPTVCPAGYSGTYTVTNTRNAACTGYTTTNNSASACSLIPCAAASAPTTAACGSGYNTGNITTTYTRNAAPACTQTSAVSNTCSCSLITSNTPTACPAGFTGTYTVTNTPNAACSGYTTSNNQAAACVPIVCPPASAPTTAACGAGFNSGNITTSYTMGPSPACTQTSSVANTCSCTLAPSSNNFACPAGFTGTYTVTSTPNAACTGSTTTNNSGTSCVPVVCPPASAPLSSACGFGYNSGSLTTNYTMGSSPSCIQSSSVSSSCSCTLTPSSNNFLCPAGFTGNYTVTSTPNSTCTGFVISDNSLVACTALPIGLACVIPSPSSQIRKFICPILPPNTFYQNGGFYEDIRNFDPVSCMWGNWNVLIDKLDGCAV